MNFFYYAIIASKNRVSCKVSIVDLFIEMSFIARISLRNPCGSVLQTSLSLVNLSHADLRRSKKESFHMSGCGQTNDKGCSLSYSAGHVDTTI
jgi:hypothetical protein